MTEPRIRVWNVPMLPDSNLTAAEAAAVAYGVVHPPDVTDLAIAGVLDGNHGDLVMFDHDQQCDADHSFDDPA